MTDRIPRLPNVVCIREALKLCGTAWLYTMAIKASKELILPRLLCNELHLIEANLISSLGLCYRAQLLQLAREDNACNCPNLPLRCHPSSWWRLEQNHYHHHLMVTMMVLVHNFKSQHTQDYSISLRAGRTCQINIVSLCSYGPARA